MSATYDMQKLVNAQIEVNRALFIANAKNNPEIYKHLDDVSDKKVIGHIEKAIKHLQDSLK